MKKENNLRQDLQQQAWGLASIVGMAALTAVLSGLIWFAWIRGFDIVDISGFNYTIIFAALILVTAGPLTTVFGMITVALTADWIGNWIDLLRGKPLSAGFK